MNKSVYLTALLAIIIILVIYLFRTEYYKIFPSTELVTLSKRELRIGGIEAMKKGDDPVSAIVLYNYTVIGRGYNTIQSDTNIVGHAVINAINDVVRSMGWSQFNGLDKKALIVMTTTEPCELCKAVIKEYEISRVEFMNKQSLDYWLKSYWEDISYELGKRKLDPSDLQDSLYQLKSSNHINSLP
jgi:tRNA(Arg) A34 adenosine deaminase TadA